MNKPEDGLYVARVAEGDVKMMHADEDTVCDAQTQQVFSDRDKAREEAETQKMKDNIRLTKLAAKADYERREADKLAKRRKRQTCAMIKDAAGMLVAGAMVLATYHWGLLAAVACTTACVMGSACRVISYVASRVGADL